MDLTKAFEPEQYAEGLESWEWVDLSDKEPLFASLFGSVFLRSADGCWFVDIVEGTVTRAWETQSSMEASLGTAEGRDRYLLAAVATEAAARGITPARNEVYDFVKTPVLGGDVSVANIRPTDFVVALNIAGQIHGQVRNLPPGTKIGRVEATERRRGRLFGRGRAR